MSERESRIPGQMEGSNVVRAYWFDEGEGSGKLSFCDLIFAVMNLCTFIKSWNAQCRKEGAG